MQNTIFTITFLIFCIQAEVSVGLEDCHLSCSIPLNVELKCGSNGITYQNQEELLCAKRNCFPDLYHAHNGPCIKPTLAKVTMARIIPTNLTLLESSTSHNLVNFDKPKPFLKKKLSSAVRDAQARQILLTFSKCRNNMDACFCGNLMAPVCASTGTTYGNQCLLDCAKKCDSILKFHHTGFCGKIFFKKAPIKYTFFRMLSPDGTILI